MSWVTSLFSIRQIQGFVSNVGGILIFDDFVAYSPDTSLFAGSFRGFHALRERCGSVASSDSAGVQTGVQSRGCGYLLILWLLKIHPESSPCLFKTNLPSHKCVFLGVYISADIPKCMETASPLKSQWYLSKRKHRPGALSHTKLVLFVRTGLLCATARIRTYLDVSGTPDRIGRCQPSKSGYQIQRDITWYH